MRWKSGSSKPREDGIWRAIGQGMAINQSPKLDGKRVLVTGGTTGVGRATAALLARQGCRVFICGSDPRHLEDAIKEIEASGGEVGGTASDLGTTEGIHGLFAAADKWLGGLDIAILNAGLGSHGLLIDMEHEECRKVIHVNLVSYVSCALEGIKRMKGKGGQIVMTGSMSAELAEENAAVYVATKAGVRGFAYSLRKEANPMGIRVSLVEPGSIGTDMVDESPEQQKKAQEDLKMLKAEDIAESILFILSQPERCDVITMQVRPRLQII